MIASECPICDLVSTEGPGCVWSDDRWWAGIFPGADVPGWIVLSLRRHAEGITSLTPQELSEIGSHTARITAAIEATTDAERVHLYAFGETLPHWHLLITPRGPGIPVEHRSGMLVANAPEYVDPERATEVAASITAALAT